VLHSEQRGWSSNQRLQCAYVKETKLKLRDSAMAEHEQNDAK